MPAMHELVLEYMKHVLTEKRDFMVSTIPFEMSHEECINLVAPVEHVHVLTQASKFASVVSSEGWMTVPVVPATVDGHVREGVQLRMRTHDERIPPLMPRDPEWQPGQPAGAKVIEWMNKRYEIGRRFGTALRVLELLYVECDNGHQIRYMWPAVLHLCKAGLEPRMDRWMEKHVVYRPCKFTPHVTPAIRAAIQDSSALLTSLALLGDKEPIPRSGAVDIMHLNMCHFQLGDTFVPRM